VDLSVGEAQRLNLLRAIALKPDVLLLDEPTSALDSTASDILLAHIKQIQAQQNLTTIMVSHRPDEINRVGNFLLTINEGSIRIGKISGDLNE
jgi:ABC-type methionine transport system ATPase subunit